VILKQIHLAVAAGHCVQVAALPTLQFKIFCHLASTNDGLAVDGLLMIRRNAEDTDTEGTTPSVHN